jgi:ornithine decarboxylase
MKAVLITSPTAQGVHADLKSIEKIVHSKGKILMVDEAWGSLMPFNDRYPISAAEAGADIVVQSNHKDACAFIGSGLLHVCSGKIDISKVKRQMSGLLSTSPSFWILSSQDACRRHLAYEGYKIAGNAADMGDLARKEIRKIQGFSVLDERFLAFPGCHSLSPNRVTVFMDNLRITGWELCSILVKEYGIYTTYPSFSNFVAGGSYSNTVEEWQRLFKALQEVSKKYYDEEYEGKWEYIKFPRIPPLVLSPLQANNISKERLIPLEESLGKIAAQTVCAYPPGIPILVEGEKITANALEFIEHYIRVEKTATFKSGGLLLGLEDNNKAIPVIDN